MNVFFCRGQFLHWPNILKTVYASFLHYRTYHLLAVWTKTIQTITNTENNQTFFTESITCWHFYRDKLLIIVNKTIVFLRGFYSDFALELLSSIDYISIKENSLEKQIILIGLEKWSDRKRTMFSNPKYLEVSIKHLQSTSFT